MQKITPFLWFNKQAEEAAEFYVSIFKNSKINNVSRYGSEGKEVHGMDAGTAMVVDFTIEGQNFQALNGGPHFTFSEAISFLITVETQEELDYYWNALSADPAGGQCGWTKDKFGLSWQIVPTALGRLMSDPDKTKAGRVMSAMLKMKKLDIAKLNEAYAQS